MTNIIKRWINKLFGKAEIHIPRADFSPAPTPKPANAKHRRRRDHMARRIFRGVAVPRAGAIWE